MEDVPEKSDGGPVVNVTGELVMLGPMDRARIQIYQRWLNNFETLRTQGEPVPVPDSLDGVTRWYESHFMGGQLWDTVLMECLSTGFADTD